MTLLDMLYKFTADHPVTTWAIMLIIALEFPVIGAFVISTYFVMNLFN